MYVYTSKYAFTASYSTIDLVPETFNDDNSKVPMEAYSYSYNQLARDRV